MSPGITTRTTTWKVFQILFTSIEARLKLLTDHRPARLPSSGSAAHWFFADVPIETDGGVCHGLEFAIEDSGRTTDAVSCLEEWMKDSEMRQLCRIASVGTEPTILNPELFAARWIPPTYAAAATVASRRSFSVLSELRKTSETRAAVSTVRHELRSIYAAFLPNTSDRRRVLGTHAAWLESLGAKAARKLQSEDSESQGASDILAGNLSDLESWQPVATHVREEVKMTARALLSGNAADINLLGALVARFAHLQVVRLWGPERSNAFVLEAALLRSIASESLAVN